jgi:hypothetical protein
MTKDQIITIIRENTTATTIEEAIDVYYAIFGYIDTSHHDRDDVLFDLEEARQRGDTTCAVND